MKMYLATLALVLSTILLPFSFAMVSTQSQRITGWTILAGAWTINSRSLTGTGVSAEVVSTQTFSSDRTVTIQMRTVSTTGTGSTCCAYYTARANGKYVDFYNKVFMDIWTNGIINLVISNSTTYTNNGIQTNLSPFDTHTIKMIFLGNNVTVFVDGVQYWNITDSRIGALGNAGVGLSSWGSSTSTFGIPKVG